MNVGSDSSTSSSKRAIFLAGTLTGAAFGLLWGGAGVLLWTMPEKAGAVSAIVAVVMMSLTLLGIVVHQVDAASRS